MERIQPRTKRGISSSGVRLWGMLFVVLGAVGKSLIQNRILGMSQTGGPGLEALLETNPGMMSYVTAAVVLMTLETCAVPIFAFLISSGMQHTGSVKGYMLRVLGTAVLAEIPYNLVNADKILDFGSRNPVFGLLFAMIAINFCLEYPEKNLKHRLIRLFVTVCSAVWCGMLKIAYGGALVIIACVLWAFRAKPSYRNLAGAVAAVLCSLSSMFFVAAPMGFMAIMLHNGEEGEGNRYVNYLAYPAVLLAVFLIGKFLM